jgi:hypothetical protein
VAGHRHAHRPDTDESNAHASFSFVSAGRCESDSFAGSPHMFFYTD